MPIVGRVFLTKVRSFSCDASKKSSGETVRDECKSQQRCKDETEGSCSRKIAKSRCGDEEKKCEKPCSRQKDTCDRDSRSSRNDKTCKKQEENESKPCEHHICPELHIRKCIWEQELEDPSCSRKQNIDRCSQSKVTAELFYYIIIVYDTVILT